MTLRDHSVLLPLTALVLAADVPAQGTELVSVDSTGAQGSSFSRDPGISGDGRYVVFETWSALDPADTNGWLDVYLHDRATGVTTRVSTDLNGGNPNDDCYDADISADGRYVVYTSEASDMVLDDDNFQSDVFRWDRLTGATALVSASAGGGVADWASYQPSVSGDGRYVAFTSAAGDIAGGDNSQWSIFVKDMQTGAAERITDGLGGEEPNHGSDDADISADGRFVTFGSTASNLVPDDDNGKHDVFLRDRQTGVTVLVSVASDGTQSNRESHEPCLSDDGRWVAFWSWGTNLVDDDTNLYDDVFLRDTVNGVTTRISVAPNGDDGNFVSKDPSISADGRHVAYRSWATNIVAGDTDPYLDAYVHDVLTGETRVVSVDANGVPADGHSDSIPVISADGRFVAFDTWGENLVPNDVNGQADVFVHDYGFEAPAPDVRVNGLDGPLTVAFGVPLDFTIGLDAGDLFGQPADWWVQASTPFGDFWLPPTLFWLPSANPILLLQFPLVDFAGFGVLTNAVLPPGSYELHFYVDDDADGLFDGTWSDSVSVTVQ